MDLIFLQTVIKEIALVESVPRGGVRLSWELGSGCCLLEGLPYSNNT